MITRLSFCFECAGPRPWWAVGAQLYLPEAGVLHADRQDQLLWIFTAGEPDAGMMSAVAGLTHSGQPWVIVCVPVPEGSFKHLPHEFRDS